MSDLLADLVARAAGLPGRLLGLTGAPGAGKSTLSAAVVAAVPGAVVLPMDGFHLTTARLRELGRVERRGAPDTFDADGFVDVVRQVAAGGRDVRAPGFDRSIEEPVRGAITVPASAPLVVVEGNYLLVDAPPWNALPPLLHTVWYVEVDEALRLERLTARFVSFGWDPVAAAERVRQGSDARNARVVEATRPRADLIVDATGWSHG